MPNTKTLYVRNLIKACTYIQGQMHKLVTKDSSTALETLLDDPKMAEIRDSIHDYAKSVEDIFEANEASAANLSVRSRRSYQWLKFLSDDVNLHQHMQALKQLYSLIDKISAPRLKKKFTAKVSIEHYGESYTMSAKGSVIEIKIYEAFIFAPKKVLNAFIKITYKKDTPKDRLLIKEFADSETYFEVVYELEHIGVPLGANAQGEHYNLEEIFERVNRAYFDNQLEQPHLTWNRQLTYRVFGHYQYATDTLMLSRSLDLPDTPDFLLDFVMYHELLHKKLGYNVVKGRRYGHTPAFRKEERKFKKYQEAKDYMKKLSQSLS